MMKARKRNKRHAALLRKITSPLSLKLPKGKVEEGLRAAHHRLSEAMPAQLVTIEGIIGAGKTTVARHIANTMPDTRFFPAPGRSSNPHWAEFRAQPEQHCLSMQLWFLKERLRVYLEALSHMHKTGQSAILDFSLWSDEAPRPPPATGRCA